MAPVLTSGTPHEILLGDYEYDGVLVFANGIVPKH